MPLQDKEPIPDNYTREWIPNETQRQDENGNLEWEKQLKRDIKAGIPATPILNFPAGGYWKYTAINPDGPLINTIEKDQEFGHKDAIVYSAVPEIFTHFTKQKDYEGKATKDFKGVKKDQMFAKRHLQVLVREDAKKKFDEYYLDQFGGDELARDTFRQETEGDWSAVAKFEGDLGFIATRTQEGGVLPGSLMDTAPVGYYWKRDAEGNDVWKDGRRIPAPLYEGKGITRAGAVASHLQTHGRNGMYGGEENIKEQLEETYIQNNSYIGHLATKYAPDTTGANYSSLPTQTPMGEEDKVRGDGTKLTRDWTMENIQSIDPATGTMGDPLKRWALSSEGQAVEAERKKEFMKWMYSDFVKDQEKYKGTPFEDVVRPWGFFGVKYPMTASDWNEADRKKKEYYDKLEAEHKASINVGLDIPNVSSVGGVAVQDNGVVLDNRGRPTGQVLPSPDTDTDTDSDDDDPFAAALRGERPDEIVVERVDSEDENDFQDDGDTYGRRITSGQGKQTRWDAGK